MAAKTEDGTPSPIEKAMEDQFGPVQPIEGLPKGFAFYGRGTDGGALFHKPCSMIVGQFEEHADPALIVQAANDHWCRTGGTGLGAG